MVLPDKAREVRCRRWAKRLGFTLRKSRARNWSFYNQLEYMLVDSFTREVVRAPDFDMPLAEAEGFLQAYEDNMRAADLQEARCA